MYIIYIYMWMQCSRGTAPFSLLTFIANVEFNLQCSTIFNFQWSQWIALVEFYSFVSFDLHQPDNVRSTFTIESHIFKPNDWPGTRCAFYILKKNFTGHQTTVNVQQHMNVVSVCVVVFFSFLLLIFCSFFQFSFLLARFVSH